jgi:Cupin domain
VAVHIVPVQRRWSDCRRRLPGRSSLTRSPAETCPHASASQRSGSAHGARTAWHSHAVGQTLHVTEGVGRAQARGGEVIAIRLGDTVYTAPGEWHWHGAAPDRFMTDLAIWEALITAGRSSGATSSRTRSMRFPGGRASIPRTVSPSRSSQPLRALCVSMAQRLGRFVDSDFTMPRCLRCSGTPAAMDPDVLRLRRVLPLPDQRPRAGEG